jgi:hypothetical protein
MIWLSRPDQPKTTEFAPAMAEGTEILPGLPAVAGKPVHVSFDGGLLTSDAGILLLGLSSSGSKSPSAWPPASKTPAIPSGSCISVPR